MTQAVRLCKYGCSTKLGEFHTKENKFRELDGTLHTKVRCQSLKEKQNHSNGTGNGNDLSLEVVLKKLESIGITLDLEKLRNAKI
jgi:hypothetical protein